MADYEKAIQTAFQEVADALATEGTMEKELKAIEEMTEAYKTAYDLAQTRYRHGSEDFLTVLDSQGSYVRAQKQLTQAQQARAMSLVTLYKTLGGGAVDNAKAEEGKVTKTGA